MRHIRQTRSQTASLAKTCAYRYILANRSEGGNIAETSAWFGDLSSFTVINTDIRTNSEGWIKPYDPLDVGGYALQVLGEEFYLGGFHLDDCVAKMSGALKSLGREVYICPYLTDIGLFLTKQRIQNKPHPNLREWMKPKDLRASRRAYAKTLHSFLHEPERAAHG